MTISLKHTLVSAVVDNAVAGEVGPSEWNDEHVITMATAKMLGRATAGTGAVEEIAVTGSGSAVLATAPTITDAAFVSTGTTLSYTYTDNGAASGPIWAIVRETASAAGGDAIGQLHFKGRNSAAALISYGAIAVVIDDATSTSEDSQLQFYHYVAGTLTANAVVNASGWNFAVPVIAMAGTSGVAPIKFQTGTNLTVAAVGAWEFDGTALYFTAVASSRQVVAVKQGAWATAVVALTNNITTAQSIFAGANDTITLAGSTSYRFRARLAFNTGATTHTTSFGFGGAATFTSIDYVSQATSSAANALAAPQMRRVSTAAAAALTATSVAVQTEIWIEGIVRVNAGGTVIPQVTFNAGPTGTCETAINSFIEFEPIGSNTVAAVGNWA